MRNKEIEQCVFNLTSGIQCKDIPSNLKKISDYIDKLERETSVSRHKLLISKKKKKKDTERQDGDND